MYLEEALRRLTLCWACLLFGQASAQTPDPAQFGPYEVGAQSFTLSDPTRIGNEIHLIIWYPTQDDVSAAAPAVYQQLPLPFTTTSDNWLPFVGRKVYGGVSVAAGLHPMYLYSSAVFAWLHTYEAVKFASHGFLFVGITHVPPPVPPPLPPAPPALPFVQIMAHDVRYLLDVILQWSLTPGNPFYGAIDRDRIIGGGHGIGGRAWVAATSVVEEFGLPRETRISALVLTDATREALTLAQMQGNLLPAFINAQHCRTTQLELQQNLASKPSLLGIEGYTATPSAANHGLFFQSCMAAGANLAAGNSGPVPPSTVFQCHDPAYRALQKYFADTTSKYTIAFLKAQIGDSTFRRLLAPGQVTEPGVHLFRTSQASREFCDRASVGAQ